MKRNKKEKQKRRTKAILFAGVHFLFFIYFYFLQKMYNEEKFKKKPEGFY